MEKHFDPKQMASGIKVEKEHTDSSTIALKIALDHLREDPVYYSKLDIMEHTPLSRLQSLRKHLAKTKN